MNFDRLTIAGIFGKALSDQLAGSAVSTDGLQRFTTKALLAELGRRIDDQKPAEPEAKVDSWLPIDEVTGKFFKGINSEVIAKYLGLIGHPYRLQPKATNADFSVRKIFLVDTMQSVAKAFERSSRKLGCDGDVGSWFHPFVGRYERKGCTCKWDLE